MKTKARVIFARSSTGMVAVQTSTSSITVFELLGCEQVSAGDILSGDLEELHNQEIYNETRDEDLKVFIHECGLSLQEAVVKHFAPLAPVISNK